MKEKEHRVRTCEHFTTVHLTSHQPTSFYSLKRKLKSKDFNRSRT